MTTLLWRNHSGCKLPRVPEISEHIVVLLLDVGEEAGVVHHGVHEAHLRLFWQRSVPTWTEPVELRTPLCVSSRRVPGLGRCGARVIRGAHTLQSTEYSDTPCHVSQSITRTNLLLRVKVKYCQFKMVIGNLSLKDQCQWPWPLQTRQTQVIGPGYSCRNAALEVEML